MSGPDRRLKSTTLFAAIACVFAGCASKDDINAADIDAIRNGYFAEIDQYDFI